MRAVTAESQERCSSSLIRAGTRTGPCSTPGTPCWCRSQRHRAAPPTGPDLDPRGAQEPPGRTPPRPLRRPVVLCPVSLFGSESEPQTRRKFFLPTGRNPEPDSPHGGGGGWGGLGQDRNATLNQTELSWGASVGRRPPSAGTRF